MKFKKLSAFAISLLAVGALVSCGENTTSPQTPTDKTEETAPEQNLEGVMTYAEYIAAEDDSEVTVAGYIQAKQSWWSKDNVGRATVYLQDDNGGYFLYELGCTEEQFNTDLAIGNHIKVSGIKATWKGMVEVMCQTAGAEATYELLEGTKVYQAKAQTSLDNEALIALTCQKVSFSNLTVVSVSLPTSDGGDIYYDVTDGTTILTFAVESYLTNSNTDVYKTAVTLKAGDVISCEGFMYVYNNAQLHTTSITKANKNVLVKAADSMTYEEYVAAAEDDEVTVEGFIQAKQAWWSKDNVGRATIYLQDEVGAYFLYELPCTEEQYNTDLAIGNHIKVTGVKGSWKGMVEVMCQTAGAEATYELLEGVYLAPTKELSLSAEDLISYSTQKVAFSDLTVVSVTAPTSDGGDIYFDVTDGTTTLTFAVESYLTNKDTTVYKTVLALKAGDKISCEGFMYVYEKAQLHTTSVTVVTE